MPSAPCRPQLAGLHARLDCWTGPPILALEAPAYGRTRLVNTQTRLLLNIAVQTCPPSGARHLALNK
eukprot:1449291-Lingulodinium_polyedra.AAC.1